MGLFKLIQASTLILDVRLKTENNELREQIKNCDYNELHTLMPLVGELIEREVLKPGDTLPIYLQTHGLKTKKDMADFMLRSLYLYVNHSPLDHNENVTVLRDQ